MRKRIKQYWSSKSSFGKITDILFLVFLVALLFPAGRMAIGGGINRIKALIVQPGFEKNRIQIGEDGQNWTLTAMDGSMVNIQDYDGKVKFINLWATWCPPCIGEKPEIQKLYDKFMDNDDVAFFMISDEELDKIQQFKNRNNYTFPVFRSSGQVPLGFRSRSIPTSFIISKNNEIVVRKVGAANWGGKKTERMINSLLLE
jgi:thiol-disulfide isomerase/thioredoxin